MESSSFLPWVIAAVALFWAIGAYNRLVRLRSEAKHAFAVLESELTKQIQLVQECVPPEDEQTPSQFTGGSAFWGGLQGAAAQLQASLAAARNRPLDPERIAALGAAQEVLSTAWDRAERDDAHDLAGPRLPENFSGERAQRVHVTQAATEQFNQAVARYNDAIAQFPAILLAWLFGFHPGRGLRARQ
ncbi:LemA family protein [Ramlibacter alkalitolerans]|uniref:LemA family protein n=1 Tax=Ramlibacter alkalitolerans TaxID=2039631 RepID=A0ABS1JXB2_9BURK|nr:LemA family protein [Ramlibacter alkalitolerans]MBL0428766.1 LemA family protein [Ramlibacter alkalitolerans]